MGASFTDLFRSETEFNVKASEMYAVIREAAKAEFLENAAKCDVPSVFTRQIMTGKREDAPFIMAGIDLSAGKDWTPGQQDSVQERAKEKDRTECQVCRPGTPIWKPDDGLKIVRKSEQGAEWIGIQDIIRKGRAPVSLPVGTEIEFNLKNGDLAVVAVAAVNHYDEQDAVFHFRRTIGRHCMNENNTNKGGWHDSEGRRYINEELIQLLPDELIAVIAEHTTVQIIDGETVDSQDKLFLPSEFEAKGKCEYAEFNGIDKQLPLFEERIKRIVADSEGDPCWWWLADPFAANTTNFCCFSNCGQSFGNAASGSGGIAPLFVIK